MASNISIDTRSGFCKSNSVFYSKRKPIPLPPNESLDVTTFISSRAHHGKTAFIDASTGRHVTFSELWRAVDSVATCLSDMGIRKGHVILLLSPNSIFFPIVCLAVMSLGAVITTTNPLNTEREIAKQVADSKPVLAFTISQLIPKLTGSTLPIVLLDDQKPTSSSILFLFFVVIALAVPLIDAQVCLPNNSFPPFLVDLKKRYTDEYGDYLLKEKPHFFVGIMWLQLLFQWPLALINIFAILTSKSWFNTTCLIYGSSVLTSMAAVLAELMGSGKGNDKLMMMYCPFMGLGVLALLRGLVCPSSKTASLNIGKRPLLGRKKKA